MTTGLPKVPFREEHRWDKLVTSFVGLYCIVLAFFRTFQVVHHMIGGSTFDKEFYFLMCQTMCLILAVYGFNSPRGYLIIPLTVYTGVSGIVAWAHAISPLFVIAFPKFMDIGYHACATKLNSTTLPFEDGATDCVILKIVSSSVFYAPLYQVFVFFFVTDVLISCVLIRLDAHGPPMFQTNISILTETWYYWISPIIDLAFTFLVVHSVARILILQFAVNRDEEFYLILFFLCLATFFTGWLLNASFIMLPIIGFMLVALSINLNSAISHRQYAFNSDYRLNTCVSLMKSSSNATSAIDCFNDAKGKTFYDFIQPAWVSFILLLSIIFCARKFRQIYRKEV